MRDILAQLSLGPKTLEEILQETGGVRSLTVKALNTLVAQGTVQVETDRKLAGADLPDAYHLKAA